MSPIPRHEVPREQLRLEVIEAVVVDAITLEVRVVRYIRGGSVPWRRVISDN